MDIPYMVARYAFCTPSPSLIWSPDSQPGPLRSVNSHRMAGVQLNICVSAAFFAIRISKLYGLRMFWATPLETDSGNLGKHPHVSH